ncbi:hypothetical protein [Fodinicola acaciae]|uniref:hypothetical protein n=1 Tax=Fodinicola acaciae TaxID=2681555 RepID=UPI0013D5BD38|nr:hypothetical protein [Fodinicola acaciae]
MSDPIDVERQVAWELHVELATRIAVVPLAPDSGVLAEAVASLSDMAARCRESMRGHRPLPDTGSVNHQVEVAARELLVDVIDPFLVRWRAPLLAWRSRKPDGVGDADHERSWDQATEMRADLQRLTTRLRPVAERLAELAGGASLLSVTAEE